MQKIITTAISVVTLILLNGCGATAPKTAYQPIAAIAGKSRLYIYFECSADGRQTSGPNLTINGKSVAFLNGGSYYATNVAPGKITVSTEDLLDYPTLELSGELEADKDYYLSYSVKVVDGAKPPFKSFHYSFEQVSAATAQLQLGYCVKSKVSLLNGKDAPELISG